MDTVEEQNGRPVLPPRGIRPDAIDAIQKDLLNLGNSAIQPYYHPLTGTYDVDGRNILVLWVPGGETRPYKAKVTLSAQRSEWAYYIRRHSSTVRARGQDERELFSLAATVPFDDRYRQTASLDDLSHRLIREFLGEIGSELASEAVGLSVEDLGRRLNVVGGRPLQTTLDEKKRAQVHQRLIELLATVQRKVFGTVAPGKIVELFKLNEDDSAEPGIATDRVVAGFFSFLGFPRLLSNDVVRKAIARGVQTGLFGYTTGRPNLGDAGRYQLEWSRIAFQRTVADDEIDLDSGFLILPKALPEKLPEPGSPNDKSDEDGLGDNGNRGGEGTIREGESTEEINPPVVVDEREIALSFTADRDALFNAWNALANLADISGEVSISARAKTKSGFDNSKLENDVLEPLRELGLIDDEE